MSADEEALEPLRLHDDPGEPPELREALVREQTFRVDYDASKGLARFRAAIEARASGAEPSCGPNPSSRGTGRSWARSAPRLVGLAALIAGASVGITWLETDEASLAPEKPTTSTAAPEAVAEPSAAPVVPTLAVEALPTADSLSANKPGPALVASARRATAPAARPTAPPAPAVPASVAPAVSSADPLEETRHLGALRQLVAADPQRALAMVDEGNRRFAGGSFREEREAIAVDALARLGRTAEARRAAEAFLVTYPTSPLAPSVRRAAGL